MNKNVVLSIVPFLLLVTSCNKVNYGYKYPESNHLPSGDHFVFWLEVENYIKEEVVPNYSVTKDSYSGTSQMISYSFDVKLDKRVPLKTLNDFFSRIEEKGFERSNKKSSDEKYYIASNWKSVKQVVKDEYTAKWQIENRTTSGGKETKRYIYITVATYYDDKFDKEDYGLKINYKDNIIS